MMNTRTLTTSIIVAGLGMVANATAQTDAVKPNILWICTDQQRWDTIHALGNEWIQTPNLDRLVKEGVAFTRAYCNAPICTASRASFLTGMYPSTVQGCKNGAAYWPEQAPLVTKLIKDNGYVCGLSGKLHLSGAMVNNPEKRPADDGYTDFHYSHGPSQGGDKNDYLRWLKQKGYTYKQVKALLWKQQVPLHQTTWCCDRAISFMEKNAGNPSTTDRDRQAFHHDLR
jgi:arylsulfatase A-like enzyme